MSIVAQEHKIYVGRDVVACVVSLVCVSCVRECSHKDWHNLAIVGITQALKEENKYAGQFNPNLSQGGKPENCFIRF